MRLHPLAVYCSIFIVDVSICLVAWSLGCGCLSLRCTLRTRLKAYEAEVEELRAERVRLGLGYYLDTIWNSIWILALWDFMAT